MAKKANKKTAKKTPTTKRAARRPRKSNVEILVEKGALDAGAAARLDPAIAKKINAYKPNDVKFLIDHQLEVCGVAKPAPDGSFF
jgi:hypothetical protein